MTKRLERTPPALLVVDDEAPIRRLLRRLFKAEGFRVFEAANGAELFAIMASESIDVVTLDIGLGAENGLDLARRLSHESDVGLIMVTGRDDMIDTVVGLEVGADDYIAKPFELRLVLARVRALLRRTRGAPERHATPPSAATPGNAMSPPRDEPHYRFGGCTLWPGRRELESPRTDAASELTGAEFDLLEVLVANAQQVLSRDRIMDGLKGRDWHPSDRTIDNRIARLRRKLAARGVEDPIRTVRGVGYLFADKVHRVGRHET